MDKTTAGSLGVAAGLAAMGNRASCIYSLGPNPEALHASFLCRSPRAGIQDAVAVMKADDEARERASDVDLPDGAQLADYPALLRSGLSPPSPSSPPPSRRPTITIYPPPPIITTTISHHQQA